MAYQTRNIIVGAAAVYVSVKDSTSNTWVATTGSAATSTEEAIIAGQGGPSLPIVASGSITVGFAANSTDWRHVGLTGGGVEVAYSPDFGNVEVDQLLDDAKLFRQKTTVSVKTSLTEATLGNVLLAWGQQNATLTTSGTDTELGMSSGSLGDDPVERVIAFVGPGPRGSDNLKRERVYLARRALQVEASSHSLSRAEATMIPVSLRLLPDPLFPLKEYGLIRDRVIS
jgi:hypothetical protein